MKKVLFVCLGNICRSPAAEGVMRALVERAGLSRQIEVRSAGTIGNHQGELPDPRMRKVAGERGYELTSRARQFAGETDLNQFDYVVTMDDSNYGDVIESDPEQIYRHKICRMIDFCQGFDVNEVPDPYYGSTQDFHFVIDLLEDGCVRIVERLKKDLQGLTQC